MKPLGGTYSLVLRCRQPQSISVGRLGDISFSTGYYVYVGSAFGPGGVRARVRRHARVNRTRHWHIDYVRPALSLEEVWFCHDRVRQEHRWAAAFAEAGEVVNGFGCSDCRCPSHLFYFTSRRRLASVRGALGTGGESGPTVLSSCQIPV